ncbi:CDP-alcohol phosphatidyltransferase family protein [Candidatus Falkowbacteria bacterium]|nr:CDP-alcohol phosphatidyltransferase family protein [Candidatus Falkowbacteria bacterium]
MTEEAKFAQHDRLVKIFLPIIPNWLKPNYLTFCRLILSPIVAILLVADYYRWALAIFIILALTDMFDGAIARLRNQITEWGKIWDPVADKLLIGFVIVLLLFEKNLALGLLILLLEFFFVLGAIVRMIKSSDAAEIKANIWGKIKMILQCTAAGLLILSVIVRLGFLESAAEIIFYISLGFASMSLIKHGI